MAHIRAQRGGRRALLPVTGRSPLSGTSSVSLTLQISPQPQPTNPREAGLWRPGMVVVVSLGRRAGTLSTSEMVLSLQLTSLLRRKLWP